MLADILEECSSHEYMFYYDKIITLTLLKTHL